MKIYVLLVLILLVILFKQQKIYEFMDTNKNNLKNKIISDFSYSNDVAEKLVGDLGNLCSIEQPGLGNIPFGQISTDQENELLMKDYKLKIKTGELFHGKLNSIEQDVFKKYYGDNWKKTYADWNYEREKYLTETKMDNCKQFMEEYETISAPYGTINKNNDELEKEIRTKIKTLDYLENIDSFNDIIKDNNESSDIYKRKIQYRDVEQSKLEFYNYLMNWIYYILLIGLLLILTTQGKINLVNNGIFYIILILLPVFIYPFLFNIGKFILNSLLEFKEDRLPKNAFMD
jgi:hypothetical protein